MARELEVNEGHLSKVPVHMRRQATAGGLLASAARLACGCIGRRWRRVEVRCSRGGSLARNLRAQVGQFLALALQLPPQHLLLLLELQQALASCLGCLRQL